MNKQNTKSDDKQIEIIKKINEQIKVINSDVEDWENESYDSISTEREKEYEGCWCEIGCGCVKK